MTILIKEAIGNASECAACSLLMSEDIEVADETSKKINTIRNIPIKLLMPKRADDEDSEEMSECDEEALFDEERELAFKIACLDASYKKELSDLNDEIAVDG